MSYDLFVFAPDGVPRDRAGFHEWFADRREAVEQMTPLPTPPGGPLGKFYEEMTCVFPDLNGPTGKGVEDVDILAGYEFQQDHIYIDFRWSLAAEACNLAIDVARETGLGLFDLNSLLLFPEPLAGLGSQENP